MDDVLNEFLEHILQLSDECQRKEDTVHIKLIKDVNNRLRYIINALIEIKEAIDGQSITCTIHSTDIADLIGEFSNVSMKWKDKEARCKEVNPALAFHHLRARTAETSRPGRPVYEIDFGVVRELYSIGIPITKISSMLSIHRSTLYRHMNKHDVKLKRFDDISNDDLDSVIKGIKRDHPFCGERMMAGFLISKGLHVSRSTMRKSIHRVDPINTALRWVRKTPCHVYSVPGPNPLWHNDGCHKLIHWRFVIHACIDGFSRIVTSLVCADNNRAETAFKAFLSGVEEWGLPARVRGDHGTENNGIEKFMNEQRGDSGYLRGPSVHNQRIERLHYDTKHCVLSHFINLFKFMEESELLDRCQEPDIFALHFVFLPRIQKSLDAFKNAWKEHPMSTEKGQSPLQIWTLGMIDFNNENQRAVRDFLLNEQVQTFGLEGDIGPGEPDEGKVEVRRIDIGEKQDEISAHLMENFDPFYEDNNHGIDIFVLVKKEVLSFL